MLILLGLGKSSAAFLIDVYLSEFTSPVSYPMSYSPSLESRQGLLAAFKGWLVTAICTLHFLIKCS
jgi:hypothetical protein